MAIECYVCINQPEARSGIWTELEPATRFDQQTITWEIHHPSHRLLIGFDESPVRWDYAEQELELLGNGNYHQGVNAVGEEFFRSFPANASIYQRRPFAQRLQELRRIAKLP